MLETVTGVLSLTPPDIAAPKQEHDVMLAVSTNQRRPSCKQILVELKLLEIKGDASVLAVGVGRIRSRKVVSYAHFCISDTKVGNC